jgi:hypothetical protein
MLFDDSNISRRVGRYRTLDNVSNSKGIACLSPACFNKRTVICLNISASFGGSSLSFFGSFFGGIFRFQRVACCTLRQELT